MLVFLDSAERLLTEKWLATQPEQVILALAQLIRQAQDENVRPNYWHLLVRSLSVFVGSLRNRCGPLLRSYCAASLSVLYLQTIRTRISVPSLLSLVLQALAAPPRVDPRSMITYLRTHASALNVLSFDALRTKLSTLFVRKSPTRSLIWPSALWSAVDHGPNFRLLPLRAPKAP